MTFKPCKIFYFLLICIVLGNQQTTIIAEKILLENSIRDKVESSVSKLLGGNNFLVIVNVEYSTVGGVLTPSNNTTSSADNGYSPFPGLPTVPSRNGSSSSNKTDSGNLIVGNSLIGRIEVNIDIDEKINSFSIKEDIKTIVKKTIPALKKCNDCIKIGILQSLPNEKSNLETQLADLKKQVEELRQDNEKLEDGKRISYLKELEDNYKEIKKILDNVKKRDYTRLEEKRQKDSLRILVAIEEEKERHKKLIDDKKITDQKLEKMMNSKIKADSVIISEAMDMYKSVMKKKGGGDYDDDAFLGMQIGNSNGGGILIFSLFLLLITCVIAFFYFMIKKTNAPIYLKQTIKSEKPAPHKDSIASNRKSNDTVSSSNDPSPSIIKHDEDATISELQSMQKTAVSLTVGEKESASSLINEWLEDNPKQNDNSSEE